MYHIIVYLHVAFINGGNVGFLCHLVCFWCLVSALQEKSLHNCWSPEGIKFVSFRPSKQHESSYIWHYLLVLYTCYISSCSLDFPKFQCFCPFIFTWGVEIPACWGWLFLFLALVHFTIYFSVLNHHHACLFWGIVPWFSSVAKLRLEVWSWFSVGASSLEIQTLVWSGLIWSLLGNKLCPQTKYKN